MFRYLIILFLFVACRLFGNESVNEMNYFSPTVTYGDATGVVGGHVNVITGDFLDYGCDLIVPGPTTLTLERNYASSVFKQSGSNLHSWHLNHESHGLVSEVKCKEGKNKGKQFCTVEVSSPHGSKNEFSDTIPKKNTVFTSTISSHSYSKGFTNTSSGIVSGQTNLKNTLFQFTKKSKNLSVVNGEGTRYTYVKQKNPNKNNKSLFCLDTIQYPCGNKVFYKDYKTYISDWSLPSLIKSVSANDSKVFGEIYCHYNKKGQEVTFQYKSDKGKSAVYTFRVYKGIERKFKENIFTTKYTTSDKLCLTQVSSSLQPTVRYDWEEAGKDPYGHSKERFRIKEKIGRNHKL